jgi:hypothetical protein
MKPSIILINPKSDFTTYFDGSIFAAAGFPNTTYFADLAIVTLAALVPEGWDIALCDENISELNFDIDCDFVGITGKVSQSKRMAEIAREFRLRGKTVLIGGPYASLDPESMRPHCDILVRGEIEEIAAQLFSDLESGCWQPEYIGDKPSLALSPVPRWDLYPNERASIGVAQTSRGCPFLCDFCDVIQYAGRKQRHKAPGQLIQELDVLYAQGYRAIFLADDNFTAHRARSRELLLALRDWNFHRQQGKVRFSTQLSIDAAEDPELLALCAEAGLTIAYIGIETSNPESLRQAKKTQNLRGDLIEQIHTFFAYGIQVIGGMIVGFDADGPDIFEGLYRFAMLSGVPIFTLGALVAPVATPLHERMKQAGRLKANGSEIGLVPWKSNIIHPTMTEEQLNTGRRWLANRLYAADALCERLLTFIDKLERHGPGVNDGSGYLRPVEREMRSIIGAISKLGPDEKRMMQRLSDAWRLKPDATGFIIYALFQYLQVRHVYQTEGFWEPQLAALQSPWAKAAN